MFPLKFCGEVDYEETRAMGLSSSEDRMIVARVFWHDASVKQTDGQTDRIYHSYSALHSNLGLCADALQKPTVNF